MKIYIIIVRQELDDLLKEKNRDNTVVQQERGMQKEMCFCNHFLFCTIFYLEAGGHACSYMSRCLFFSWNFDAENWGGGGGGGLGSFPRDPKNTPPNSPPSTLIHMFVFPNFNSNRIQLPSSLVPCSIKSTNAFIDYAVSHRRSCIYNYAGTHICFLWYVHLHTIQTTHWYTSSSVPFSTLRYVHSLLIYYYTNSASTDEYDGKDIYKKTNNYSWGHRSALE
jgi:hypothetical protein